MNDITLNQTAIDWIYQKYWYKVPDSIVVDDARFVPEALSFISPDDYETWIQVGMALKQGNQPFSVWDDWSKSSPKYASGECEYRWDTFHGNEIKLGTLFHLAKQNGFIFPFKASLIGSDKNYGYEALAKKHIDECGADEEKLIETAFRLDDSTKDPYEGWLLQRHYFPLIKEHLSLDDDTVLEMYEAFDYKRKQKRSAQSLQNTLSCAQEQLSLNKVDDAQATIIEAYHQYQKACKAKYKKPIVTMAEGWEGFCKEIETWRERPILGFRTGMTQLTNALLGLRGLILIAAEANLGKTILVLQLAVSALEHHPDACCIFLSLEMDRSALYARAGASAINSKWVDFIVGGSDDKNNAAKEKLGNVMDRLVIVDRDDFDESEEKILQLASELRERTGCTRTLIVIDYLQVMDIPVELERAFRTELEQDRYRMESMKRLRSALNKEDALLVVSEIRKGASGKGKEKLTNEDLIGSVRLGYAADTILLWQSLTTEEKYQWMHTTFSGIAVREFPLDTSNMGKDGKETIEKEVKKIDEYCKNTNSRPAWLEISKARDGTIRKSIPITAYYNELQIQEGFFTRGTDGAKTQTEAEANEPFTD